MVWWWDYDCCCVLELDYRRIASLLISHAFGNYCRSVSWRSMKHKVPPNAMPNDGLYVRIVKETASYKVAWRCLYNWSPHWSSILMKIARVCLRIQQHDASRRELKRIQWFQTPCVRRQGACACASVASSKAHTKNKFHRSPKMFDHLLLAIVQQHRGPPERYIEGPRSLN